MNKIKNIIFDMGNVIILYSPAAIMTEKGVVDSDERDLFMKEIFRSWEWEAADRGEITVKDIEERCLKRLPERLHRKAHECIAEWFIPVHPIAGMEDFIREMKGKGIGIYLLSNAPDSFHQYWNQIPASKYFDGVVLSADIKMVKPTAEAFTYLLDKYKLKADECIFVDDLMENVEGSERVGIKGFQFRPGDDPYGIENAMKA